MQLVCRFPHHWALWFLWVNLIFFKNFFHRRVQVFFISLKGDRSDFASNLVSTIIVLIDFETYLDIYKAFLYSSCIIFIHILNLFIYSYSLFFIFAYSWLLVMNYISIWNLDCEIVLVTLPNEKESYWGAIWQTFLISLGLTVFLQNKVLKLVEEDSRRGLSIYYSCFSG